MTFYFDVSLLTNYNEESCFQSRCLHSAIQRKWIGEIGTGNLSQVEDWHVQLGTGGDGKENGDERDTGADLIVSSLKRKVAESEEVSWKRKTAEMSNWLINWQTNDERFVVSVDGWIAVSAVASPWSLPSSSSSAAPVSISKSLGLWVNEVQSPGPSRPTQGTNVRRHCGRWPRRAGRGEALEEPKQPCLPPANNKWKSSIGGRDRLHLDALGSICVHLAVLWQLLAECGTVSPPKWLQSMNGRRQFVYADLRLAAAIVVNEDADWLAAFTTNHQTNCDHFSVPDVNWVARAPSTTNPPFESLSSPRISFHF